MNDYSPIIDSLEREVLVLEQKQAAIAHLRRIGSLETAIDQLEKTLIDRQNAVIEENAKLADVRSQVATAQSDHEIGMAAMLDLRIQKLAAVDEEVKIAREKALNEINQACASAVSENVEILAKKVDEHMAVQDAITKANETLESIQYAIDVATSQKTDVDNALAAARAQIVAFMPTPGNA